MITKVAIIGCGRFGRALAELFTAVDLSVACDDPYAEVPEPWRRADRQAVLTGADLVVLAVPIPALKEVMGDLKASLAPDQIVIDVASVKLESEQLFHQTFGTSQPWVACHPLFGPVSISRGDVLRVALCPNPQHPKAEAEVDGFFRGLGWEVLPVAAAQHDREMAETHALAFFLAKGMRDAGFDLQSALAPPSVAGLRQTLDTVAVDAGQLYASLQRANPFAAAARQQLLESLTAADFALRRPQPEGEGAQEEAPALRLGETPPPPPQLLQTRARIDELDGELLKLLVRRAALVARAAHAKQEAGCGIRDEARERALLDARRHAAKELQLDPEAIAEVFSAIMAMSRRQQARRLVDPPRMRIG